MESYHFEIEDRSNMLLAKLTFISKISINDSWHFFPMRLHKDLFGPAQASTAQWALKVPNLIIICFYAPPSSCLSIRLITLPVSNDPIYALTHVLIKLKMCHNTKINMSLRHLGKDVAQTDGGAAFCPEPKPPSMPPHSWSVINTPTNNC